MRVCAIAGGVGSARLCAGFARVLDRGELTVAVNTGDDERIRGLHICPDVDTVLYHLADLTDWQRGWGLAEESFVAHERYQGLVARLPEVAADDLQEWFALGDRDLATHLVRGRLLDLGRSLTDVTAALAVAFGISSTVLPMSDDPVRTMLTTTTGERLDFQTYFVRRHHTDELSEIDYEGVDAARPAPGVIEAIQGAEIVVIPPSNPLLSVGPVLAVPGVRTAIERSAATRIAISPIVGGRALKGPADRVLAALGHEVSPVGVANLYRGLVDSFVLDAVDAGRSGDIEELGIRPVVCDTIMSGQEEAARLAKDVIDAIS
ncbi:MAG: 2-phospho-L-lactate transferase [Actinomycetota bacterium]